MPIPTYNIHPVPWDSKAGSDHDSGKLLDWIDKAKDIARQFNVEKRKEM